MAETATVVPIRKAVEREWTPEQEAELNRTLEEYLEFALRDPLIFQRPTRKFKGTGNA